MDYSFFKTRHTLDRTFSNKFNSETVRSCLIFLLVLLLCIYTLSCKPKQENPLFKTLDYNETGIGFRNDLVHKDKQNILDFLGFYNGGGVGVGDFNNDGLPDIYFSSNQHENKLYQNLGGLRFKDITSTAGVGGKNNWNTGVAIADVNGDGLLDIYVCAIVGIHGLQGKNELFINNGDGTFIDRAGEFGLDFKTISTQAYFFDFDLDNDLDLFLLNYAIHTSQSLAHVDLRNVRNELAGDRLLRNDNGHFVDVSENAGIFGGVNGYGLSASIADYNRDGYPDIYVCNDFFEDDYYYVNKGDGTFKESLKDFFGHTSLYSMGSDAADVNNDGYMDLMTLDMLPADEYVLKTSGGDMSPQGQINNVEKFNHHFQYSRNMLQVNQQAQFFSEQALLNGVAGTDWSWSVLLADFNQDSYQDIFITNGVPKRANDLDYVKFISDSRINKMLNSNNDIDEKIIDMMPDGALINYFFEGTNTDHFTDRSSNWSGQKPGYSNGAAYGDLDNDGDLDLITNNINDFASIYVNQTNNAQNFLKVSLIYQEQNTKGIGSKVFVYNNGQMQVRELFPQRGFLSSSEPILHFGLSNQTLVDSLKIIWPNNSYQILYNVSANQNLTIRYEPDKTFQNHNIQPKETPLFLEVTDSLGIHFKHQKNKFLDFSLQPLMPYQTTDRNAAIAVGDLNSDGLDDIYFGNSHGYSGAIYIQSPYGFESNEYPFLEIDNEYEDTDAVILDFNGDGQNELLIASGGGQYTGAEKSWLQNRVYTFGHQAIEKIDFDKGMDDTSIIRACDYDKDGDVDVFVGNATTPGDFGKTPESYLLKNVNGKFSKTESDDLSELTFVRDAIWTDFNSDGQVDLLVVGEWMQPTFLENVKGDLLNKTDSYLSGNCYGLWRAVFPFDIDADGDLDYLLGNWGKNTKFKASINEPLLMYYGDFDNNNQFETLLAQSSGGSYYPLDGLDKLSQQLKGLTTNTFSQYSDFAEKNIDELFGTGVIEKARKFQVQTLASGVLINQNNQFTFEKFSTELQVSPINCFQSVEDNNGKVYIICGGNYFGVTPFHGRFDGFPGAVLKSNGLIIPGYRVGLNFFNKSILQLKTIKIREEQFLIAVVDDNEIEIYKIADSQNQ